MLKGDVLNKEAFVEYLEKNVFNHISGVRNYTVLIVQALVRLGMLARGDVVMSMDDDAPPETYLLKRKVTAPGYEGIEEYSRDAIMAKRYEARAEMIRSAFGRGVRGIRTVI